MTNKGQHYNVGEKHPRAKLTAAQVAEIRRRYVWRSGRKGSTQELAAKFGIGAHHVSRIARGEAWK